MILNNNHIVEFAQQAIEARQNCEDEFAEFHLKKILQYSLINRIEIFRINQDELLGSAFRQMFYLDVARNETEKYFMSSMCFMLLTNAIRNKEIRYAIDSLINRASLYSIAEEKIIKLIELNAESIKNLINSEVIPKDVFQIMQYGDIVNMGEIGEIVDSFKQTKENIERKIDSKELTIVTKDYVPTFVEYLNFKLLVSEHKRLMSNF